MPRLTLDMPKTYIYSTEMAIRTSDTNGNHLSNYAVLALMDEARVRFLKANSFTDDNIMVTDSAIIYKAEGFHGDELQFQITAGDFNKYGCDIYYLITKKATGVEVAHAKTGVVFYDYQAEQMMLLPEVFSTIFSS